MRHAFTVEEVRRREEDAKRAVLLTIEEVRKLPMSSMVEEDLVRVNQLLSGGFRAVDIQKTKHYSQVFEIWMISRI
jgi:hypothetical protein